METLISGLNELLAKIEKNGDKKRRTGAPNTNLLNKLLEAGKQYDLTLMEEGVLDKKFLFRII